MKKLAYIVGGLVVLVIVAALVAPFFVDLNNYKPQIEAKAKEAYAFVDGSFADLLGRRFGVGWGNRLERQMLDFVPVVVAAGGTVGEAVDHILATKLLRKVRDRHDTRPEDLTALSERIAEAWPKLDKTTGAVRSMAIVRDELRRLGAEEEA